MSLVYDARIRLYRSIDISRIQDYCTCEIHFSRLLMVGNQYVCNAVECARKGGVCCTEPAEMSAYLVVDDVEIQVVYLF